MPKVDLSDKTVLIIGGGIAGLSAAYALRKNDKNVKIQIVEPKEYAEVLWASYRSPFVENVAKQSLIVLSKYCAKYKIEHIQAIVTKLDDTSFCQVKLLADGEAKTLTFDLCVIATGAGSYWPGMGRHIPNTTEASTPQARLEAMRVEGNRILNAKSLVIIGGGLIGTELAGDVAAHAKAAGKSNDITLVHSGDRLCPMMSEPASKAVLKMLENLNVKVILNEKAVENADGAVELLNSKKTLNANAVIQTIGFTPNNTFVDSTRFPKALDDLGWIQTDDFFVVPGTDGKIFAYGDCSPTLPNAGFQYMEASSVLGRNLYASLTSKPNNMKPKPDLMVGLINTIGTSQGIMYTSFFWTRRVVPWLKNKTMFFMALNGMIGVKKDFTMAAT